RDAPLPGVDAEHHLTGEPPADALEPAGVFERTRADDDPGHAPGERLRDVGLGPQPAAELAGDAGGPDDAAHTLAVDGAPLAGAVQVHDVQRFRPLPDPAAGHGGGVAAEDRLPGVVPLPQPHTLAAPQVDGREDLHRFTPFGEWWSGAW